MSVLPKILQDWHKCNILKGPTRDNGISVATNIDEDLAGLTMALSQVLEVLPKSKEVQKVLNNV